MKYIFFFQKISIGAIWSIWMISRDSGLQRWSTELFSLLESRNIVTRQNWVNNWMWSSQFWMKCVSHLFGNCNWKVIPISSLFVSINWTLSVYADHQSVQMSGHIKVSPHVCTPRFRPHVCTPRVHPLLCPQLVHTPVCTQLVKTLVWTPWGRKYMFIQQAPIHMSRPWILDVLVNCYPSIPNVNRLTLIWEIMIRGVQINNSHDCFTEKYHYAWVVEIWWPLTTMENFTRQTPIESKFDHYTLIRE